MRRHLLGLLAGFLLTPLLWLATTWGIAAALPYLQEGQLQQPVLLSALAALGATGLACGILAGSRISPLAALLPGVALLGLVGWPLVNQPALEAFLPAWLDTPYLQPGGVGLVGHTLLGTVLLVSALLPSRWRHRAPLAEAHHPRDTEPPVLAQPPGAPPGPPVVPSQEGGPGSRPEDPPPGDPSRTTVPMRRNHER